MHQDVMYDFTADLTGIGDRPVRKICEVWFLYLVVLNRCGYLGLWLDLTTTHRQTWLFSSTSTYHLTDFVTARGVAHLVVHGTSGSTSYETM